MIFFSPTPTTSTYLPSWPYLQTNASITLGYFLNYWSIPTYLLTYLLKRPTKVAMLLTIDEGIAIHMRPVFGWVPPTYSLKATMSLVTNESIAHALHSLSLFIIIKHFFFQFLWQYMNQHLCKYCIQWINHDMVGI